MTSVNLDLIRKYMYSTLCSHYLKYIYLCFSFSGAFHSGINIVQNTYFLEYIASVRIKNVNV